jgi:hypothetical protein
MYPQTIDESLDLVIEISDQTPKYFRQSYRMTKTAANNGYSVTIENKTNNKKTVIYNIDVTSGMNCDFSALQSFTYTRQDTIALKQIVVKRGESESVESILNPGFIQYSDQKTGGSGGWPIKLQSNTAKNVPFVFKVMIRNEKNEPVLQRKKEIQISIDDKNPYPNLDEYVSNMEANTYVNFRAGIKSGNSGIYVVIAYDVTGSMTTGVPGATDSIIRDKLDLERSMIEEYLRLLSGYNRDTNTPVYVAATCYGAGNASTQVGTFVHLAAPKLSQPFRHIQTASIEIMREVNSYLNKASFDKYYHGQDVIDKNFIEKYIGQPGSMYRTAFLSLQEIESDIIYFLFITDAADPQVDTSFIDGSHDVEFLKKRCRFICVNMGSDDSSYFQSLLRATNGSYYFLPSAGKMNSIVRETACTTLDMERIDYDSFALDGGKDRKIEYFVDGDAMSVILDISWENAK